MRTGELRRLASWLLRAKCREDADLLTRAAASIDAGQTDMDLATALVECASRMELEHPAQARRMRDAALHLVLIA